AHRQQARARGGRRRRARRADAQGPALAPGPVDQGQPAELAARPRDRVRAVGADQRDRVCAVGADQRDRVRAVGAGQGRGPVRQAGRGRREGPERAVGPAAEQEHRHHAAQGRAERQAQGQDNVPHRDQPLIMAALTMRLTAGARWGILCAGMSRSYPAPARTGEPGTVCVTARALTPLYWFFRALAVAALGVEVWPLVDAVRRPGPAFVAAGKQTKPLWLVILGVAAVIGLWSSTLGGPNLVSLFPIIAFVAAAI